MKRNAPEHPKVEMLRSLLGCGLAETIGILELLWHFTARYTPRGNIGIYSDEIISRRCGYEGSAEKLINALLCARWIDSCETNRLVVHDWAEHCDDTTHMQLAKKTETFYNGKVPNLTRFSKESRIEIESKYHESAKMRTNAHECADMRTALPFPSLPGPSYPSPESACVRASEKSEYEDDLSSVSSAKEKDVLDAYPTLKRRYPKMLKCIAEVHDMPLVTDGSQQDIESRRTLAVLATQYGEKNVIGALHWCLKSSDDQALYWRTFTSFSEINTKLRDGKTKFSWILAKWKESPTIKAKAKADVSDLSKKSVSDMTSSEYYEWTGRSRQEPIYEDDGIVRNPFNGNWYNMDDLEKYGVENATPVPDPTPGRESLKESEYKRQQAEQNSKGKGKKSANA